MTDWPTTSIAWPLAKQSIQIFEVQLDEVACESGWPGDRDLPAEVLWVDQFVSDPVNVPVMQAGRKQRDETVVITYQLRVAGRDDIDATHVRMTEIVATIENAFAEDPTLGEFGGVISAEVTSHRQTCTQTPTGPIGFAEIVATIETRLV